MEIKNEIKSLGKRLKIEYGLFWMIILLQILLFELEVLPQGTLVGDGMMEYIMQLSGIVMMIAFIPLSLKMFSIALKKYISGVSLADALPRYARWSEIRLALLLATVVFNISVYYTIMDTTGLMCAGMAVLAALFCVPGADKIMQELNLNDKEE